MRRLSGLVPAPEPFPPPIPGNQCDVDIVFSRFPLPCPPSSAAAAAIALSGEMAERPGPPPQASAFSSLGSGGERGEAELKHLGPESWGLSVALL